MWDRGREEEKRGNEGRGKFSLDFKGSQSKWKVLPFLPLSSRSLESSPSRGHISCPPPLYWLHLCNLSTQLCFLSAPLPTASLLWLLWPPWLPPNYLCSSVFLLLHFGSPFPCPPPLPLTPALFLASAAFPMITLFSFSLWFLCPLWLSQFSSELRKPQTVQRLISVWISTQTCECLCGFFTETLWI